MKARTIYPAFRKARTTADPIKPLAPVMSTRSLDVRFIAFFSPCCRSPLLQWPARNEASTNTGDRERHLPLVSPCIVASHFGGSVQLATPRQYYGGASKNLMRRVKKNPEK